MTTEDLGTVTSCPREALRDIADAALSLGDNFAMVPHTLVFSGRPSAVVVYAALDRQAAKDGRCFASLTGLAERTGLAKRTVQTSLAWLVKQEFVTVASRGSGRTATHFVLPFHASRAVSGSGANSATQDRSGLKIATQGGKKGTPRVATARHYNENPYNENQINEKVPSSTEDGPQPPASGAPEKKQRSSTPEETQAVATVFEGLQARRGYPSPNHGGEAKATRWMLRHGYTAGQILDTYDHLKAQAFWVTKTVTAMSIQTQIGEHVHGRHAEPRNRSHDRAPEASGKFVGLE